MLSRIQRFFELRMSATGRAEDADSDQALRLATAALLIEMMQADFEVQEEERQLLFRTLKSELSLSAADTAELIQLAEEQVAESVSLYSFTRLINDHFSYERKTRLVELLWRVAFADDQLEEREEHLVRKIANLIYVSHEDFIAAKKAARKARQE